MACSKCRIEVDETDVKKIPRNGGSDEEIARTIRANVKAKWSEHEINSTVKFVPPALPRFPAPLARIVFPGRRCGKVRTRITTGIAVADGGEPLQPIRVGDAGVVPPQQWPEIKVAVKCFGDGGQ